MNDLNKKEETYIEENNASRKKTAAFNALLQKKLENYLLLLYQGYLKGETDFASEIRAAFLNLVKQDKDFALKVRMMQLDLLNLKDVELEGEWNEATEELFPEIDRIDKPADAPRKKLLTDYKETIVDLLKLSSKFGSET